jgi:serine/threonine protein kinase
VSGNVCWSEEVPPPHLERRHARLDGSRGRIDSAGSALGQSVCRPFVATDLGHAHSRGVLHRDVKPENILLAGYSARAGGAATSWRALVADFGLARAIGAADYQRLTETGVIVGTVFYMSPEQLKEDRSLDQRADIYSLGCILFEMLTGAPPYTGSSISDIVRRILRGTTPSAARMNREVPPEVELAVSRALARSPAERFQSMREFADALAPKGLAGSSNDAPPGWLKP